MDVYTALRGYGVQEFVCYTAAMQVRAPVSSILSTRISFLSCVGVWWQCVFGSGATWGAKSSVGVAITESSVEALPRKRKPAPSR